MSTSPAPQPTATAEPKRVKKRIYIPTILLVLLLVVGVGFYVRGTWADTVAKDPDGPDAGTVTQLLQKQNGNVEVRCAVVVDAPPKDVWAVVTDYAKHPDFLPYVKSLKADVQPDGQTLIDGVAHSRIWGSWPFQSMTTHLENPKEGAYSALWSEEDKGEFKVSRGGWSLTPIDKNLKQTLLVFNIQVELKSSPNFLVRNIIMDRLHTILKAVRDETLKRNKA